MSDVQQVEQQKTVTGNTVFSFVKPTPIWAVWFFRIVYWVTGIAIVTILADKAIPSDTATRIVLYLTGLDKLVWLITRAIGVNVEREVPKRDL